MKRDLISLPFDLRSKLNPVYFSDQVHYLRAAEKEVGMPDLFSALEVA